MAHPQGSDAARVKAELSVEDGEGWSDWINAKRPNGAPLERWAGEWDISILEVLPDEPGRYEWGIKAPDSDMVVPVYHGKTGGENSSNTLKKRLVKYARDGSHGAMQQKMDELLKKGFTFYVRVKPEPSDIVDAAEKEQLKKVDYAFNLQEQGRSEPRDPILFTGKKVKDYPQLTTRQQPDRRCKVTTPDALAEERQRAKSEWDTFRSAIKGQGLSVEQQSKLYRYYKAQGQLDVHEEPPSAAPAAVKTETERELDVFHSLVKEEDLSLEELSMLYQDYKAEGLLDDRKPPSTAPEAEKSRAESEWDVFRRSIKDLGLSREEQSALYEDYKATGLLDDGPVEAPRSTSPVARSRAESEWDVFRRSVKDLGLSREEQSELYEDYKAQGLLGDSVEPTRSTSPASRPHRAESEWDVFRREVRGQGLSRQEQSELYQEQVRRQSSTPPVRTSYERAGPEPATRAPPSPPSNPFNAFQQAHTGMYTRAQMAPAYHASRQSTVSHAPPAHVPTNPFNAFQQAHAGMYTRAQMAPAYHAYRQSTPSHSAPAHVPRNPYNAFQQANAGRYSRSEMSAAYRAHKSGRG